MRNRRIQLLSFSAALLLLLPLFGAGAQAASSGAYSMEILVNGRPLAEYSARGTRYIEAIEGREYSIRLRNRTGRRVAVALAVDGLNTIDARHTDARRARKWVLDPWETVTIDGWQTSLDTARRFYFTSEASSYGAWLGKTADLGVISAAFFPEKRPPRRQEILAPAEKHRSHAPSSGGASAGERSDASAAEGGARQRSNAPSSSSAKRKEEALSDELAATGIGRETANPVREVQLELVRRPAATLSLRYEYHDALVRLGVIPGPVTRDLERREQASGFRGGGFAPDPFDCRR